MLVRTRSIHGKPSILRRRHSVQLAKCPMKILHVIESEQARNALDRVIAGAQKDCSPLETQGAPIRHRAQTEAFFERAPQMFRGPTDVRGYVFQPDGTMAVLFDEALGLDQLIGFERTGSIRDQIAPHDEKRLRQVTLEQLRELGVPGVGCGDDGAGDLADFLYRGRGGRGVVGQRAGGPGPAAEQARPGIDGARLLPILKCDFAVHRRVTGLPFEAMRVLGGNQEQERGFDRHHQLAVEKAPPPPRDRYQVPDRMGVRHAVTRGGRALIDAGVHQVKPRAIGNLEQITRIGCQQNLVRHECAIGHKVGHLRILSKFGSVRSKSHRLGKTVERKAKFDVFRP